MKALLVTLMSTYLKKHISLNFFFSLLEEIFIMEYFQNSRRRSIPSPSVSRLSPGYFPGNYNCLLPFPSFDQIPGSKSAILITHWRGARHPLFRLRKSAIFKSLLTRKSVILSVTLKSTIWIAPREGNDPPF